MQVEEMPITPAKHLSTLWLRCSDFYLWNMDSTAPRRQPPPLEAINSTLLEKFMSENNVIT